MKRYFLLLAALLFMVMIACQKTVNIAKEEEAIKEVIKKQVAANNNCSFLGEDSVWAHDPFVIRLQSGSNPTMYVGWDSVSVRYKRYFERLLKSTSRDTVNSTFSNHHFRILNNAAWVVFDQRSEHSNKAGKYYSNSPQVRFLEKRDNQWRIVFHYTGGNNEDIYNSLANYFYNAKKMDVALEIFKRIVELYPNSEWVYFNLGGVYLEKGNKKLAIENYEKCLKLNPNNIWAANSLKKLRGN